MCPTSIDERKVGGVETERERERELKLENSECVVATLVLFSLSH